MAGRRTKYNQRIGFIGRNDITEFESAIIWYIGRCIARLGRTLVIVPAEGAANRMREGVESERGEIELLQSGVMEAADHTLLYPNPRLLERLKQKYPDLETRDDVAIITRDNLHEWFDAIRQIMTEKGIELPE